MLISASPFEYLSFIANRSICSGKLCKFVRFINNSYMFREEVTTVDRGIQQWKIKKIQDM